MTVSFTNKKSTTEKPPSTTDIGKKMEGLALQYLRQKGLILITQNYRCSCGEIDLIMRDRLIYVFVEVRYRANNNFGGPLASITINKQRKLIKTATYFLQQRKLFDHVESRFDVIGLDANQTIEWIKNAYYLSE